MRSLSHFMPKVTKASLGKKGLLFGRLLKKWSTVIGPQKAKLAIPKKLSFHHSNNNASRQATLYLSTTSAYATLLNHEKTLLLEKINTFFGYNAVRDLKFVHDLAPSPPKQKKPLPPLDPKTKEMVQDLVASVEDDALRQVLLDYGCSLKQMDKQ